MAKTDNLTDFLTDLADAIRTKKGIVDLINPQSFRDEILSIVSEESDSKFGALVDGSIVTIAEDDLSSVNNIREKAFMGCINLTSVVTPSNIQTIGASAFEGCSNLQTLILADGVQTIGASAFKGINASAINIPSTLSVLEDEVFANNTALTSITIPSNITELKDNVFNGCTNLTEITMEGLVPSVVSDTTFPASVTAIYVKYGAYDSYLASWTAYVDKIVRLPAIPSTITVIVNNYLNELVQGATVTIEGNGQTFTGTTNENGVFAQGGLHPDTYTVSFSDIDGFKTPDAVEVVVEEDTQQSITITYLEKPSIILFADATPAEISAISAEISANNMTSSQVAETYGWNLGDTKDITLSTGEVIQMQIIGFNHDDKSDGSGKAGVTLQMVDVLATRYPMNSTATNVGGYAACKIKNETLPTIKSTLPQEWQDVIKLVDKKSANGGGASYSETLTTSENLFLLAGIELFGSEDSYGGAQDGANEGSQYEYWIGKVATDRIKQYDKNGDGIPETDSEWWLRSSGYAGNLYFCSVRTSGYYAVAGALGTRGISFAFCV